MRKFFVTITAIAVLGLAGIASATTYSFDDKIDKWGGLGLDAAFISEGNPLSYSHNINGLVNFAAGDLVTAATLELDFTNDSTDDSGSRLWGLIKWDFREYAKVGYDGHDWVDLNEVDDGQYNIILVIDWLNVDGILDVTVKVSNDLGSATAWLDHSRLYGTAETTPVPEPGTMVLLGVGMLGLAIFGKRWMNKA